MGALELGSCFLTPRVVPYEQYNPKAPLVKEARVDSMKYRENLKQFYKTFEEDTLNFKQ